MRIVLVVVFALLVGLSADVVADPYPAEFTDVFFENCVVSEEDRGMCECVLYEMEKTIPYASAIDSDFPLQERVTDLALTCMDRQQLLDEVSAEIQADIQADKDAAALAMANETQPPHEALGFTFDIPEGWTRVPPFQAQFSTSPYLVLEPADRAAFIQFTALAGDVVQPIEDIGEASARIKELATLGSDDLTMIAISPEVSLKVKKIEDRVLNGLAFIEARLELSFATDKIGFRVFYFVPPKSTGQATLIYIWDMVDPAVSESFIESLRPFE